MGKPRRPLPSLAASGPKERHRRTQRSLFDRRAPVPLGFVAKPPIPKSKHHTYFEFVENKDKKKKLEFQITTKKDPPPGFEFVPIGNPQLTTACKELSREKDAMIFIVSNSKEANSTQIAHHMHRVGHHIRQAIVEEAQASIKTMPHHVTSLPDGEPEPIPKSQQVYHAQADAAIRDLFPRIPNTDRQMILEHAFTRGSAARSEKPVGLSDDIPLARRVQLAVLAHIRHNHTRYDELLRETSWQNARRVVEALCLDILVKWRGDEETGRDQLDEILREVVVISDSEEDSDEEDSTDDTSVDESGMTGFPASPDCEAHRVVCPPYRRPRESPELAVRVDMPIPQPPSRVLKERRKAAHRAVVAEKKAQRGFQRYFAWEQALKRNQYEPSMNLDATGEIFATQRLQHPFGFLTEAHHKSDSRVPPGLNGHIQHHQPSHTSLPWAVPQHDNRHDLMWHSREKVRPVVLDQSSRFSAHRQASPSSRFEDVPVRSIEPVSPNARPSLVHTLPPRNSGPRDLFFLTRDSHCQSGPLSPNGETIAVEDCNRHSRGDLPGRPRQRDTLLNAPYVELRPVQAPHLRDRDHMHPITQGGPNSSPVHHYVARPFEHGSYVGNSQSRRIVVNAPRPGERSNPILMEDRGGFYERVHTHSDHQPQRIQVVEAIPAAQEARRTLGPQRAISRERGSRILPERLDTAEIEAVRSHHVRTRDHGLWDTVARDPFYPQIQHRASGEILRQAYRETSRPWPVSRVERAAPPPEGYWVLKRNHDQPMRLPHSPNWTSQQPEDRYQRYDIRSHHPPQPPSPHNVIVLD